jgi:hypothetical protein
MSSPNPRKISTGPRADETLFFTDKDAFLRFACFWNVIGTVPTDVVPADIADDMAATRNQDTAVHALGFANRSGPPSDRGATWPGWFWLRPIRMIDIREDSACVCARRFPGDWIEVGKIGLRVFRSAARRPT